MLRPDPFSIGSWRLVYLVYGGAELIIACLMLKILKRQPGTVSSLNFKEAYGDAVANANLLKTVGIILLMGFSIFGSFTFAGKFVETRTGYNILLVGLTLSFFGLATVAGGRQVGPLRQKLGNKLFIFAGLLASVAWAFMGAWHSAFFICLSLAGFGFGFIMIQPTLVGTAQQFMQKRRGTAMSLASFAMFTGGGVGTYLNGKILTHQGFEAIFILAGVCILVAGTLTLVL